MKKIFTFKNQGKNPTSNCSQDSVENIQELCEKESTCNKSNDPLDDSNNKYWTINAIKSFVNTRINNIQGTINSGFEEKINKSTTLIPSSTKYPTNQAVIDYVNNIDTDISFTENITVSLSNGKTAGKYVNGQTIPLVGKTPQEAFNDIFIETLVPSLAAPALSSLELNQNLLQEAGTTLSNLTATATFNRGSISPQYTAENEFRAGEVNTHIFTGGGGFSRNLSNNLNTLTRSIANYIVNLETNIFTAQVAFNIGTQPKDSAGNNFEIPLPAGSSNIVSTNIQGILPFFFGKSTNRPIINQALISSGTKIVAFSDNTLNINFDATNEFLWFAIPNTSASKTKWFVNALNNGNIGTISDLFGDFTILNINSPSSLWLNQNYKIYVSNYATSAALIELRN